ncbi:MAG: Pr6Pr family membrane protein [Aestuariivirga sp.]
MRERAAKVKEQVKEELMEGYGMLSSGMDPASSTFSRAALALASLTALVAWAGLILQLYLTVEQSAAQGFGLSFAIWRFAGFFTILTNLAVAVVASAMALKSASWVARPNVRLSVAASIIIVGLVYSVALRGTWQPTGWQAVADHVMHDAVPPLFFLSWLAAPHGGLNWRSLGAALVLPVGYIIYALARGAWDGWYAYWFLDPNALSMMQMAASAAILLVVFMAVAGALMAIDRWLAR